MPRYRARNAVRVQSCSPSRAASARSSVTVVGHIAQSGQAAAIEVSLDGGQSAGDVALVVGALGALLPHLGAQSTEVALEVRELDALARDLLQQRILRPLLAIDAVAHRGARVP